MASGFSYLTAVTHLQWVGSQIRGSMVITDGTLHVKADPSSEIVFVLLWHRAMLPPRPFFQ